MSSLFPLRRVWLALHGVFPTPIAALVEGVLQRWSGTWQVELQMGLVGGWCACRVQRDDGRARTLLFAPGEEAPATVRQSLERALESLPPRPVASAVLFPVAKERRALLRR